MDNIDAAFDDAYRTNRIEAGDDPSTLPNPYARPSLTGSASKDQAGSSSTSADTGGGFIVDNDSNATSGGGGFIIEDADNSDAGAAHGGGFMVDDDDAASNAGGFLPAEDDEDASSSQISKVVKPNTIPLSAIPEALANLGLDSSDPSVLSLFADTAYVPSSASRRRLAPGVRPEKVVGRQEFQQVASVLVEEVQSRDSKSKKRRAQDVEDEDDDEEAGSSSRRRPTRRAAVQGRKKAAEIIDQIDDAGGGGFIVDDEDNSEDDFEASRERRRRPNQTTTLDTGSDLSSEGEDDEDAELRDSATRRRRRPARAGTSPSPSLPSDTDTSPKRRRNRKSPGPSIRSTTHLNPNQRLSAQSLFSHLLSHLPSSPLPLPQRRLGTAELTTILTSLGEKLPPKEVEEMLEEAAKLFAPATEEADGGTGERRSGQAIRGAAAAQGIEGASVGLDEFAGVLVHNRLL